MNVLSEYKEVLWDNIEELGLEDNETAQKMLRAAEAYGCGCFSLVEADAAVGLCDLTGEFGPLSKVTFTETLT